MYCLAISISHPCYKRPSVETEIYFFETEQEALNKLKDSKIIFIADFDVSEDPRIEELDMNSSDELIEILFNKTSDIDSFYSDSYMDNDPFNWKIIKVQAGEKVNL